MQRRLSHTAAQDPAHQFGDLYSLLCNAVWLRVAVHHVQQNAGSETAGIDGKTMSNFRGNFDGYIEELTTTLKAETFEPCPVRRVYIPKPNSEKKRPLGIPMCPAYCISSTRVLGIILAESACLRPATATLPHHCYLTA